MVMISDGLPELPNKDNVLLDYPKVFDCIKTIAIKMLKKLKMPWLICLKIGLMDL